MLLVIRTGSYGAPQDSAPYLSGHIHRKILNKLTMKVRGMTQEKAIGKHVWNGT
jgi:hypothetical protein